MDSRYLEEYLVFSKELNYTTASKQLFITRPTLCKHIAELEDELGCRLVSHKQDGVDLTPAGKRFVLTATRILKLLDDTIAEYRHLSDNLLSVRIASTNLPWVESCLYKARRNIQDRFPDKQIDIVTVNGPMSTVDALFARSNDIVITGYKSYLTEGDCPVLKEGVSGFHLQTEEIRFLITQDHPLFSRSVIRARDFDGLTILLPPDIYAGYKRDDVVGRFAALGAEVGLATMDFTDHSEYFTYDFCHDVGVVPTTLVSRFGIDQREECRSFSLEDLPFRTAFYAVYKDSFLEDPNARLLIEEMKRIVGAE